MLAYTILSPAPDGQGLWWRRRSQCVPWELPATQCIRGCELPSSDGTSHSMSQVCQHRRGSHAPEAAFSMKIDLVRTSLPATDHDILCEHLRQPSFPHELSSAPQSEFNRRSIRSLPTIEIAQPNSHLLRKGLDIGTLLPPDVMAKLRAQKTFICRKAVS